MQLRRRYNSLLFTSRTTGRYDKARKNDITKLNNWLAGNVMKLNEDKWHLLAFGHKRHENFNKCRVLCNSREQ